MKTLHFETIEEFNEMFLNKTPEVTDTIVKSISEALKFQKGTAKLYSITIGEDEYSYEITLPKSQWETALENCIEKYTKWEYSDEAIDTYLIKKEVKKWVG